MRILSLPLLSLLAAAALVLAGCATVTEGVQIKHVPASGYTAMPGVLGAPVQVEVEVVPPTDTALGVDRMFAGRQVEYVSLRPIDDIVREGVEAELQVRGYTVGPGGATLKVQVVAFEVAFQPWKDAFRAFGFVRLLGVADAGEHHAEAVGEGREGIDWIEGMVAEDVAYVMKRSLESALFTLLSDASLLRVMAGQAPLM